MATAIITVLKPKRMQKQLYSIGFHMVYNDGISDVIDKDYTIKHNKVHGDVATREVELINQMKEDIDNYYKEKTILESPKMTAALTNIQAAINAHIGG